MPRSAKQNALIGALLLHKSIAAACASVGIAPSSYHRWMKEDSEFREALGNAQQQAITDAVRLLKGTAGTAVEGLRDLAKTGVDTSRSQRAGQFWNSFSRA